jgi:aryl-alcohol dehydrogenase-like predicted oxidoreductase
VRQRQLGAGGLTVSALGLGCMGLVDGYYGDVSEEQATATVHDALELGITLFDTADSYGAGESERRLGRGLGSRRDEVVIATKFGLVLGADPDGRVVDGRPENVRRRAEASLRRLGTDVIDLYQLHRVDPEVAIEETVGAMADLVTAGQVRYLGLSEAGAGALRRAAAVSELASVQSEYSIFERGIEAEVFAECQRLGLGLLAFAPLGKGLLTGALQQVQSFGPDDLRSRLPRLGGDNLAANQRLVAAIEAQANGLGIRPGQLALAWLLARAPTVVPIPGTRRRAHLAENVAAAELDLSSDALTDLDRLLAESAVVGERYPPGWRLPRPEPGQ